MNADLAQNSLETGTELLIISFGTDSNAASISNSIQISKTSISTV